jgi:hypothetical protein
MLRGGGDNGVLQRVFFEQHAGDFRLEGFETYPHRGVALRVCVKQDSIGVFRQFRREGYDEVGCWYCLFGELWLWFLYGILYFVKE